jgi:hypothetical protein
MISDALSLNKQRQSQQIERLPWHNEREFVRVLGIPLKNSIQSSKCGFSFASTKSLMIICLHIQKEMTIKLRKCKRQLTCNEYDLEREYVNLYQQPTHS